MQKRAVLFFSKNQSNYSNSDIKVPNCSVISSAVIPRMLIFVAALNAAAYTASGIDEIIAAGCGAIPDGTKFKTILNDVLGCYRQGLSWRECW